MPEQGEPHPEWPPGILFRPSWNIEWQYDYIARILLMKNAMVAADVGLGKTVIALGTAGAAFEENLTDFVLVVCEQNKLTEWAADVRRFTRLSASVYHGPKRKALLGDLPQVLVTTYETARSDVAVFPPKGSRSRTITPGPLMDVLKGRQAMIVYDEVTKVGHSRSSKLYKAHHWLARQLRQACKEIRVIGLTGTPMEGDLEGMFNEMRVVVPHAMPAVNTFERKVVASRHPVYGTPSYRPEGKEWFRAQCDPWILRKRKSDPDVRDQFPPLVEEFRRLRMHDDQFRLYQQLEDLAWTPEGERQDVPGLGVLLRLMAGDPLAVLESARAGESELSAVVAEELTALADLVIASGGKLLVFTRFAHTVMPVLRRRLGDRPVFIYHGGMTRRERDAQLAAFRAYPGGAVLLSSDAGSKGINVPEASYIVEYEPATMFSTRVQRAGRGHRLGREDPLTFITFVLESSVEGAAHIASVLSRNADQDFMLHDDESDGHVTADDRRELYAQARPRKAVAA